MAARLVLWPRVLPEDEEPRSGAPAGTVPARGRPGCRNAGRRPGRRKPKTARRPRKSPPFRWTPCPDSFPRTWSAGSRPPAPPAVGRGPGPRGFPVRRAGPFAPACSRTAGAPSPWRPPCGRRPPGNPGAGGRRPRPSADVWDERPTPGRGPRGSAGGRMVIRSSDLRYRRFRGKAGILFIFVVDASGSMAVNRMAQAKGAMARLLQQAYVFRDQVALVRFGGEGAETLLPPTRSVQAGQAPGGGPARLRSPLPWPPAWRRPSGWRERHVCAARPNRCC